MFLNPEKYPRWAGPFVGGAVGFVIGIHCGATLLHLGIGTGCGFVAGSLLAFLESNPSLERRPSLAGGLLAALAIPCGVMPFFGLAVCLPAFLLNREVAGWANTASRIGLVICGFTSAVLGALMLVF